MKLSQNEIDENARKSASKREAENVIQDKKESLMSQSERNKYREDVLDKELSEDKNPEVRKMARHQEHR